MPSMRQGSGHCERACQTTAPTTAAVVNVNTQRIRAVVAINPGRFCPSDASDARMTNSNFQSKLAFNQNWIRGDRGCGFDETGNPTADRPPSPARYQFKLEANHGTTPNHWGNFVDFKYDRIETGETSCHRSLSIHTAPPVAPRYPWSSRRRPRRFLRGSRASSVFAVKPRPG